MGKKVVVVDDDPDVRLFNATVVEECGHTPLAAENGAQGLDLVRNESPDLVILDVLMPKQSGIKMYRELKTDKALKHIPVIVLSGIARRSFLKSQQALAEFGGVTVPEPAAYVEKPATADELAAVIAGILG
ncbi:MAG: response regulator [Desulfobacterales bacterium]|nr:response regulator [Desulfobacterales bacterium]